MKKNKESFVDGEMQASPEGTSNSEDSTPKGLDDFEGGNESQESAEVQTIAGVAYDTATTEGKSYNTLPTNFEEVCESVVNLGVFRDEQEFKDKLAQKSWVKKNVDDIMKLEFNNDSEGTVSQGTTIDNVNPIMSFTYTISEFNSNSSWVKLQIEMNRTTTVANAVNYFLKNSGVKDLGPSWSFTGPFTVSDGITRDSSTPSKEVPEYIVEIISNGMIDEIFDINSNFVINENNLRTVLNSSYASVEDGEVEQEEMIITIKDNQLIMYYKEEYDVDVDVYNGMEKDPN